MRQDYYWTTMEADYATHVRRCHQCQVHGDLKHMPPMPLHTMTLPWPFSTWGINIIGKIHPTASNGHEFILVAIDYFIKWVEAASYKVLKPKKVAQFIQTNNIFRYGVPHEIISDNGQHFKRETEKLLRQFNIQHHKSSPYRPQTNGAIEAANKNIGRILKKSTKNYKDWHLQLPYAHLGYKTSIQSSTGAIPYSLVNGMEAVLPIKMGARSLRTTLESEIFEADQLQSRYDQLCMLDEKRLKALYHTQGYQRRLRKAFDKKVRTKDLKLGDLVLKEIRAPVRNANGKFKQNQAGPYIIKQIYSGGVVRLIDLNAITLSLVFSLFVDY